MNDDDESARNASLGDIWSTIEDQGLADLAAEVGIVSGVEPGDGDGLGGSAHMHYATDATALVGNRAKCWAELQKELPPGRLVS